MACGRRRKRLTSDELVLMCWAECADLARHQLSCCCRGSERWRVWKRDAAGRRLRAVIGRRHTTVQDSTPSTYDNHWLTLNIDTWQCGRLLEMLRFRRNGNWRVREWNIRYVICWVKQSSIDAHKYFISHRVVQCWNDLRACDKNSTSLASFKQLLNKVDLTCYTNSMVHDNVWFRIYSIEWLRVLFFFYLRQKRK